MQGSVNDYLRVLQQSEGAQAMAYSKTHNEVKDLNIATSYERERVWTICVVFNPKKSQRVEQILKQQYENPSESEVLSHAHRQALQ